MGKARAWDSFSDEEQRAENAARVAQGKPPLPLSADHIIVSDPISFSVGPAGLQPVGECLCCGHRMPLAVWRDAPLADVTHGVCGACRDAAAPLRGACSTSRGCLCEAVTVGE